MKTGVGSAVEVTMEGISSGVSSKVGGVVGGVLNGSLEICVGIGAFMSSIRDDSSGLVATGSIGGEEVVGVVEGVGN